jgi:hypothetical protein
MKPLSNLGYLTESIFHKLNGKMVDRGDFDLWMSLHEKEFGTDTRHIAFGWDSDDRGEIA